MCMIVLDRWEVFILQHWATILGFWDPGVHLSPFKEITDIV